ncbi:helix-turn-helix domain-containing protein [Rhodococcus qingshengii]|uniref:helix-turn-helix domain-containing protein n=1 Tax=Rhodococcus qingshengii TaxID=334542 RepID=UPI00396A59B2
MTQWHIVIFMPQRNNTDEILTTGQVAKEWHVSTRTVQRYIANGQLKATRLPSGHTRVRRSDAELALNP